MKKTTYIFLTLLFNYLIIPLVSSILLAIALLATASGAYRSLPVVAFFSSFIIFSFVSYFPIRFLLLRKPLSVSFTAKYLPVCLPLAVLMVAWAVFMIVSGGSYNHQSTIILIAAELPFVPITISAALSGLPHYIFYAPLIFNLCFIAVFIAVDKRRQKQPANGTKAVVLALAGIMLVCAAGGGIIAYSRRQTILPPSYGFEHGGGYSSVDIYRYDATNPQNILAKLDKPSEFTIDNEDEMPVLDGAEAAYPVYSAFANACYKRAGSGYDEKHGDEIVPFTNTIYAFERLIKGEVDIFFGAQPSADQEKMAERYGKTLALTPIGKEAFIFFVNEKNKVDDLSVQDIKDIYSGKTKSWKSFSGSGAKIIAFQRPENSGSQTILQKIMGDTPLMPPLKEERISGMGGVSEGVADYRNSAGAIGYSFRFFTTGMADNADKIKLLKINGIEPSEENIKNGAYPFVVSLYAVTLEDNPNPNVKPFLDWMQGPQGQEIIEKTGYVSLN